jgi:hypothetical protein
LALLPRTIALAALAALAACARPPAAPDLASLPIVPRINADLKAALRDVYERGLTLGNRSEVFSKIGDSISDTPAFLQSLGAGPVDYGDYADLAPIVEYYRQTAVREHEGQRQNSFQLTSFAALSGWRAADLLDEGSRFWEPLCGLDESPLECELRNSRPAIALILIGTNDAGLTPVGDYQRNVEAVLDVTLAAGVIPVLSTLPPQTISEGRADIMADYNAAVLAAAQRKNVPVWNYWLALQALPNLGLSPDGLHPSEALDLGFSNFTEPALQYGYTVRSLTALQVLAKLKAVVLDDGPPDP